MGEHVKPGLAWAGHAEGETSSPRGKASAGDLGESPATSGTPPSRRRGHLGDCRRRKIFAARGWRRFPRTGSRGIRLPHSEKPHDAIRILREEMQEDHRPARRGEAVARFARRSPRRCGGIGVTSTRAEDKRSSRIHPLRDPAQEAEKPTRSEDRERTQRNSISEVPGNSSRCARG